MSGGRAGCKKLFEEQLARDFSDFRYGRVHRLLVDTYSLQHPDAYMRSGKSFAAHLTGACAALEYDDTQGINRAVQQWLSEAPMIDKPKELPEHRGALTILHVHSAADAEEHVVRVLEWARSAWSAWAEYHELARQWIAASATQAKER